MAETRNVYRATLNYDKSINQDKITVVFNGTTYADVPKQEDITGIYYGDGSIRRGGDSIDDDYAFCISPENGTNYVYVNEDVYENHNPFTIKIIADSVTTTECFKKAVSEALSDKCEALYIEYVNTETVYFQTHESETIPAGENRTIFVSGLTQNSLNGLFLNGFSNIPNGTSLNHIGFDINGTNVRCQLTLYNYTNNSITVPANTITVDVTKMTRVGEDHGVYTCGTQ